MAINYLGKVYETTTAEGAAQQQPLGISVPAESLLTIGYFAARSGANPAIVSIEDSKGHEYKIGYGGASIYRIGIARTRTSIAMDTSDWVKVTWNGVLVRGWLTAHAFSNVSGEPTDFGFTSSTDTTPQITVDVAGSDWLTVGIFVFNNNSSLPTITPVNSSVSRDTKTTNDVGEFFSRNGTTGSTHTIGGTIPVSTSHYGYAYSFPYLESSGGGNLRGQPRIVGV